MVDLLFFFGQLLPERIHHFGKFFVAAKNFPLHFLLLFERLNITDQLINLLLMFQQTGLCLAKLNKIITGWALFLLYSNIGNSLLKLDHFSLECPLLFMYFLGF